MELSKTLSHSVNYNRKSEKVIINIVKKYGTGRSYSKSMRELAEVELLRRVEKIKEVDQILKTKETNLEILENIFYAEKHYIQALKENPNLTDWTFKVLI